MDNTMDAIIIGGQYVPAIAVVLVFLALLTEGAYQLVAHKKQVWQFLSSARSWMLIVAGFLLVAMVFAAALVGFWLGA